MDPETNKAWWQAGRTLAGLPFFGLGGFLLLTYGLSWIVFPWDREFIGLGLMFLLAPAVVLCTVGAIIVGGRHLWLTVAWLATVLGLGTIGLAGALRTIFSLPATLELVPAAERADTMDLVQRITTPGMIAGVVCSVLGLAMLARRRARASGA